MTARFEELIARGQLTGEVTAGIDASDLALAMVAHMEGLMVVAKATGDPTVIRRLTTAARSLLAKPA